MLNSLTDRSLSKAETDALSDGDGIDLVFPATPESIREDDGHQRTHDVLLFMEETVGALAYPDAESGWTVVATENDENGDAYEAADDALLEHRGYEDIDREDAMRRIITDMYGVPPELVESNPEKLDAFTDT